MRFSYNWLKELSGTKKSPEQLAEVLNLRAFEVEGIEKIKDDSVLEIKILADRGHDCLSHIGIAREICAIENGKFTLLNPRLSAVLGRAKKFNRVKIQIQDKKLCSRYIGAVMTNIKVQPSPKWMQERLIAAGLRPINNIVDATNYMMLETGQPLHAFDFFKIKGEFPISNFQFPIKSKNSNIKIIIRRAKQNEAIKLLDGTIKKLTSNDLVIADSGKALAIAGIKGGIEAEISRNTQAIVLEAANFDPVAVRKSRMRLELKTDSSDRFEKEIDPNLAEAAMARAIEIIEEFGGKLEGVVDVYPKKIRPWKIVLSVDYVGKLLGETIALNKIVNILKALELRIKKYELSKKKIIVEVPTFRLDLKTQEDLIEEIGRIYGYEKIKPQAPYVPVKMSEINEERKFDRLVKNILTGKGFSEVYNYSFYSRRDAGLAEMGTISHLELENPMNPEQELMRVSLIPGILKNVRENLKYYGDLLIFESGRVYWMNKGVLPEEKKMLVGAIVIEESSKNKAVSGQSKAHSFYKAKGYIDALLDKLGIDDYYYDTFESVPADTPVTLWHQGRSAAVKIEGSGEGIGYLGEINPLVLANFDIHKRAAIFEFDLEKMQKIAEAEREFEPIRKYPEVLRDISMIAPGNILVDEILQAIQAAGGDLVLDVDLFDIHDFEDGSTSYAFHILFGADNRTLESGEADKLMEKISSSLEKELGVKVRK